MLTGRESQSEIDCPGYAQGVETQEAPDLPHKPVMLAEALDALSPRPGGFYLDGTLGLGGHASAILARADCQLCGLDQDMAALDLARERLAVFGTRARLFHLRFADFSLALEELGWQSLDGVLLDLGVSSLQLDTPERGFSFRAAGPLDMRMDQSCPQKKAWQLVNRAGHAELRDCLAALGEEPQAGRIARQIIEARQQAPINDTLRLAEIVRLAYPPAWRRSARRHPATRTFQALRMATNDELGQLEAFLRRIWQRLAPHGRLVIISFHSLEDRLVKHAMRGWAKSCEPEGRARLLFKKPLTPAPAETEANPRAASAKLRAAEKIMVEA